jgi:hypothetical protein
MSGFELVAGVIGIFFVVGIAVGVIAVIALSSLKHHHRRPPGDDWRAGGRRPDQADDGVGWQEPPRFDEYGNGGGGYGVGAPRWPGR